jgi:3-oxoacyl-(acyl-carrier-protein) synthase
VPKTMYGHLYGAAFGTDVLCGAMAAATGLIPPTHGCARGDQHPELDLAPVARPARVDRFLVSAYSRYGTCVAMVFGRP